MTCRTQGLKKQHNMKKRSETGRPDILNKLYIRPNDAKKLDWKRHMLRKPNSDAWKKQFKKMRGLQVIKISLKAYNARNVLTWRRKTPWKKPVSAKGHKTKWRAKEEITMKLEWKRHMPETANWKATHAVKTTWRWHSRRKLTWGWHMLEKQLESNIHYENNSKATHCEN